MYFNLLRFCYLITKTTVKSAKFSGATETGATESVDQLRNLKHGSSSGKIREMDHCFINP